MTLFKKPLIVLALATLAITFAAQPARALTFTLDYSNISTTVTPYVSVTESVSGQTATFVFTAEPGYVLMDGASAGLNLNSSSFTASFVSATPSGVGSNSPAFETFSYNTGSSVDGFGTFNLQLNMHDGYGWSSNSITFTVTNNDSSIVWLANGSNVLSANGDGSSAVSHIGTISSAGACTGYASNDPTSSYSVCTTSVPDGGLTISLLGLALGGLGFAARRRQ